MKSIRVRLIALFIVVTSTTLGSFAIYEQLLLSRELEARFLELQNDVITRLPQNLAEPVWVLDQSVINVKLETALIPPDVHAVYLFDPDQAEITAGVARNLAGHPRPSLSLSDAKGVAVPADIYPPSHVDEARRKISLGKVVVYFSRDRINRTLRAALLRHTLEVVAMNLLLLVLLTLSLRMVFVPLRRLRDALHNLASNEGEEPEELPETNRTEFDEVIGGFNLTLHKLKLIIFRRGQAEAAAREATYVANEALAQVKVAQEALIEKNKQLERLTITDPLTGLSNRLKLDRFLEDELNRSRRSASEFALVLLDIDHFKSINDAHGHQVGDQVLCEMALLLTSRTRQIDVAGRWGGEEFLVICPDTDIDGALELAEKLREAICAHVFPVVGHMTASFGVTSVSLADSIQLMMARADRALYCSKAMGRNRVESGA